MTSKRQIIITSNFKGARPATVLAQVASQDLSPDGIAAGVASGELLRTHIPYESLKRMPEGVKTYAFDMAAAGVEGRGRCDMAFGGFFHRPSESMYLELADGSKLTGGPGWAGLVLGWDAIGPLQQRAGGACHAAAPLPCARGPCHW